MRSVAVRVDGNPVIGSGHVMRCCAIAREVLAAGAEASFLVSDAASAEALGRQGFGARVVGGDYSRLGEGDAEALARAAEGLGASSVLVDTYAITDGFMSCLRGLCSERGWLLAYVDDAFTFEEGHMPRPERRPVDVVVDYGFGASPGAYAEAYAGSGARLLVGPRYAPVREGFAGQAYAVGEGVGSVLVTTGSTNPRRALERLAEACAEAAPGAEIHVVVGPAARFEGGGARNVVTHRAPEDMRSLMLASDLVVSAAGTTLYEIAALGVPAVAVPVTENQAANAEGWGRLGLGPVAGDVDWDVRLLAEAIGVFAGSYEARLRAHRALRSQVDGEGAMRVALELVGLGGRRA